ncbi:MAG: hypothetical protein WHT08_03865 [Bryobacteraceae bacterium]|jgi:hypothetical protein
MKFALAFALLLLSGAEPPVQVLFDDIVDIAPGEVRTLALPLQEAPVRIACSWRVLQGGDVRLLLLPADNVDAWVEGKPYEELGAADFSRNGTFTRLAPAPRELVLAVEARGAARRTTRLRLLVRLLDPSLPFPPVPRAADRRRGEILVWSSLALFAVIAAAGAVKLRRNFASRR